MNVKITLTVILTLFFGSLVLFPQNLPENNEKVRTAYYSDSLQQHLMYLNFILTKNYNDPVARSRIQDQINQVQFEIEYQHLIDEEKLEAAKSLVEKEIENAKDNYRTDLITLYSSYKQDLNYSIRLQKVKYNHLFKNKRKFNKHIRPYFKANTEESIEYARHLSALALGYAKKAELKDAEQYVYQYQRKAEALLFDMENDFDLKKLTKSESAFQKQFSPLIISNDEDHYAVAKKMVNECIYYSRRVKSKLQPWYFERQLNLIDSKLLEKERELTLSGTHSNELVKRLELPADNINQTGIYKFQNKIVVIGTIQPHHNDPGKASTLDPNIMKGMAVMEADQLLINYIHSNVKKIKKPVKIKHCYLIPYQIKGSYEWFMPIDNQGNKQFRVAYTFVGSKDLTEKILNQYLRPVIFVKTKED